jgi:hypothetical protein
MASTTSSKTVVELTYIYGGKQVTETWDSPAHAARWVQKIGKKSIVQAAVGSLFAQCFAAVVLGEKLTVAKAELAKCQLWLDQARRAEKQVRTEITLGTLRGVKAKVALMDAMKLTESLEDKLDDAKKALKALA